MNENEEQSRELIVEEIAEAVEEENADDIEAPVESAQPEVAPYIEPEEDVVDAIEHAKKAQEPEIDPEPVDEDQAEEPVDEGIEITVDGVKQRVASSDIYEAGIRTLQKEAAADRRLELASEAKKEAEQTLEDAKKEANSIQPSEEKMKIIRQVHEDFSIHYPELSRDPRLTALVAMEADRLMSEGEPNEPETYRRASHSVKKWHLGVLGGQQADMAWKKKLSRKRQAAGTTVTGVNAKTETSAKPEPKPESPSDIVNQMRAARGQPV